MRLDKGILENNAFTANHSNIYSTHTHKHRERENERSINMVLTLWLESAAEKHIEEKNNN